MALKRGTPEFRAYMINLGAKGGRATRDKHPDHLKEIAAAGGRATKDKPKTKMRTKPFDGEAAIPALRTPEPEGRPIEPPASEFQTIDPLQESARGKITEKYNEGLLDVDAFLSSFQIAKPHA